MSLAEWWAASKGKGTVPLMPSLLLPPHGGQLVAGQMATVVKEAIARCVAGVCAYSRGCDTHCVLCVLCVCVCVCVLLGGVKVAMKVGLVGGEGCCACGFAWVSQRTAGQG